MLRETIWLQVNVTAIISFTFQLPDYCNDAQLQNMSRMKI